jgi:hypothetical protein
MKTVKYFLIGFFCLITSSITAQQIAIRFEQRDSNFSPTKVVTKKNDVIKIDANVADTLGAFKIECDTLTTKHVLIISIGKDILLGKYAIEGDTLTITSQVDLMEKEIIVVDSFNGTKSPFVSFRFITSDPGSLGATPVSKLNLLALLSSKTPEDAPCASCNFGDKIQYDFSTNTITSQDRAKVGYPFTFQVNNINPFRDSVIISFATNNYNVDTSSLFNVAYFTLPSNLESGHSNTNAILNDVYTLGQQLSSIKERLSQIKECENVCNIISNVRINTESNFKQYNFNDSVETLEFFLIRNLSSISQKDKDSVIGILNKYYAFCNAKTYFNYNIPKLQNVDEYVFNLSVLPKNGLTSNVVVDHQPVIVPLHWGIKIDASTGLFMTNLIDQKFSLKPDSSVTLSSNGSDSVYNRRNQIMQQNNGNYDFGVAAFIHFYTRLTNWFNMGLSLGAGVSVAPNPSIRYLGGASLLFGKNGRLILTYGCAIGFVNKLDENNYTNLGYTYAADASSLTKKVLQAGNFWSLTFNIPIFNTQQNASQSNGNSSNAAK